METEDQTLVQDCIPEKLDPAPIQDEYAPVIFSQETVSHIVSIDMMSGKVHQIQLGSFNCSVLCFSAPSPLIRPNSCVLAFSPSVIFDVPLLN